MRGLIGTLGACLVFLGLSAPGASAQNVQIASHVDWGALTISGSSGYSQTITPLSVPELSQAQVDWSLNVGNSTSRISPMITLSNRQNIRFGFVFVSSDVRFKQSGGTFCNVSSPNMFSEPGTYQANCTTPVKIVAGESYTVSVGPETSGNSNSWTADVVIKSTGEKINLGVVSFSVATSVLNASIVNDGYNQTSIYGPNLTCSNAPNAEVIYSKPTVFGSPFTPNFVKTRASTVCPNFPFQKLTGDAMKVILGNGSSVEPKTPSEEEFHKNGNYYLNFVPTALNLNESLSMDFTPLSLNIGEKGGRGTYYGFDWCWQTKQSLQGDLACGSFHIETYSESGSGLVGNADFFFQHGAAVSKVDNDVNCELRTPNKIAGENANYTTCWKRVIIQPNRTYTLSVKSTMGGSTLGNTPNWWKATITEKESGSSLDVGYIKAIANLYELPLASMQIAYAYTGKTTSCSQVPINDTIISPLRNGAGKSASLKSHQIGSCGIGKIGRLKEDASKFIVNYGGSNAEQRNLSLFSPVGLYSTQTESSSNSQSGKPETPKLSLLNVSGNNLNISINIGSKVKPDQVMLLSPVLAGTSEGKLPGKIVGSNATWTVPLVAALSGKLIPLTFVSSSKGNDSDPLDTEFQVPIIDTPKKTLTAPKTPTNLRSSFIGTDILISAQIETSSSAIPDKGFLTSSGLGFTKSKPLAGEVIGNKIVFSIPVTRKNFGKQYEYQVFTRNKVGDSKVISAKVKVPNPNPSISVPKAPSASATISCIKGSVLRTFLATSCPPGWKQG